METGTDFYENAPQTPDFSINDFVFVKSNGNLDKINMKGLLWIEALSDFVTINTFKKKYTIHSTLKTIESKLSPDKFIRVHHSYIISIENITAIDGNFIILDKQLIPVGAAYKDNLKNYINFI